MWELTSIKIIRCVQHVPFVGLINIIYTISYSFINIFFLFVSFMLVKSFVFNSTEAIFLLSKPFLSHCILIKSNQWEMQYSLLSAIYCLSQCQRSLFKGEVKYRTNLFLLETATKFVRSMAWCIGSFHRGITVFISAVVFGCVFFTEVRAPCS